jgi:dephospho-CoA kinase
VSTGKPQLKKRKRNYDTNGSGKGTVVDFLVKEKRFKHYAARDFLSREIHARGLLLDRSSMRDVANELRAKYEPAYVVKSLYEEAERNKEERVVIESVRNIGEAEFLKRKGALLIAVDADQKLRYERVQSRRSATDQVDFETFVEHEEREMHPVGPHDMDLRGVMALADVTIQNNGSYESLKEKVENVLTNTYIVA